MISAEKSEKQLLDGLHQWFLTFLRSGNTFDYMKNLRNIKINDPKNNPRNK